MNFGKEGFTKDFRGLHFQTSFLGRLSIKIESTILKVPDEKFWAALVC